MGVFLPASYDGQRGLGLLPLPGEAERRPGGPLPGHHDAVDVEEPRLRLLVQAEVSEVQG